MLSGPLSGGVKLLSVLSSWSCRLVATMQVRVVVFAPIVLPWVPSWLHHADQLAALEDVLLHRRAAARASSKLLGLQCATDLDLPSRRVSYGRVSLREYAITSRTSGAGISALLFHLLPPLTELLPCLCSPGTSSTHWWQVQLCWAPLRWQSLPCPTLTPSSAVEQHQQSLKSLQQAGAAAAWLYARAPGEHRCLAMAVNR